jgi:hypothetical protein
MPGLKDNIYKIMAIMSINDASVLDDMHVVGSGIIWSRILLSKPDD